MFLANCETIQFQGYTTIAPKSSVRKDSSEQFRHFYAKWAALANCHNVAFFSFFFT
jgi:hypothetical protein